MATNKFSRTNFFNQNVIDGIIENDLPFNDFNSFEFKRPRTYFTIKQQDLIRPDLISIKTLGKQSYWWVIMKLNGIDDPFNDFTLGQSIQIPALADVEEFFTTTRRKTDIT